MAAIVRPDLPNDVERALDPFGNGVRVAVVTSSRTHGLAARSELADRLDVSRSLLQA